MKVFSAVMFVLGMLLLGMLTVFGFTEELGIGALLQLGVWACAFFLAAIWLKIGAK